VFDSVVGPNFLGADLSGEIIRRSFGARPATHDSVEGITTKVVSHLVTHGQRETLAGNFGSASQATIHIDLPHRYLLLRRRIDSGIRPKPVDGKRGTVKFHRRLESPDDLINDLIELRFGHRRAIERQDAILLV